MAKTEKDEKIFCANCKNCLVIKVLVPNKTGTYLLRLKCSAGVWQKKLGNEKLHKYVTAARRMMDDCDFYDPMGDLETYIKDLRKTLPAQDEFYREGAAIAREGGETPGEDDEDDE